MSLPKGINKIIEEYCYYPRIFEKELCRITTVILEDTKRWWTYNKYYVGIEDKNIEMCWYCFYKNTYCGWQISAKQI